MLLVTGITGHSGEFFLQELVKQDYKGSIRCIVRENSDTTFIDKSGLTIEKVMGNLENQAFIDEAMKGIDTVIHIASIFHSTNVMKAALKSNVRRAILVHTTGIYSKYKSASEEYKQIEEAIFNMVQKNNSSIGLVILRPTMIYGNIYDKNMVIFIKMVDKLRLFPIINQGKGKLQPVNGRDLGRAYYQVLSNSHILHGDYILSGEKAITMKELFQLLSKLLEKKNRFISVSLGLGVLMATCLKMLTVGKFDYIEKVQRMAEDRNFSHNEARKDFGYEPMSLEEGLKIEVEEYRNTFR